MLHFGLGHPSTFNVVDFLSKFFFIKSREFSRNFARWQVIMMRNHYTFYYHIALLLTPVENNGRLTSKINVGRILRCAVFFQNGDYRLMNLMGLHDFVFNYRTLFDDHFTSWIEGKVTLFTQYEEEFARSNYDLYQVKYCSYYPTVQIGLTVHRFRKTESDRFHKTEVRQLR